MILLSAIIESEGTAVSIGDALLLAVIAISLIMAMLACLMMVIKAMPPVLKFLEDKTADLKKRLKKSDATESTQPALEAPVAQAPKALANGSCGDICLYNVEPRTAAMIMAIVANEMDTPINELRFKSIKAVDEEIIKGE